MTTTTPITEIKTMTTTTTTTTMSALTRSTLQAKMIKFAKLHGAHAYASGQGVMVRVDWTKREAGDVILTGYWDEYVETSDKLLKVLGY